MAATASPVPCAAPPCSGSSTPRTRRTTARAARRAASCWRIAHSPGSSTTTGPARWKSWKSAVASDRRDARARWLRWPGPATSPGSLARGRRSGGEGRRRPTGRGAADGGPSGRPARSRPRRTRSPAARGCVRATTARRRPGRGPGRSRERALQSLESSRITSTRSIASRRQIAMPRNRYGGRLGALMPVTRFDIRLRRPLADGHAFGSVGAYEELKGRLHFAVDPQHPSNQRITDVGLAPRNAAGRVEFAADVSILVPVDRRRASGRLVLDVVNRGNTVTVLNFNRATRPVFGAASDPDPAIDVGDGFLMRHGCVVPDPNHVHLDGGFTKGRLYQIVYTAIGAPVHGLGMAALRECVSWLKHGGAGDGHPAPGVIQHAYAYGRSQTGRVLRTMIWEDLVLDEQGREVLDGVIANVAGGMRGEFNQRFGQNSKDRPFMMSHLFPFTA